MWLYLCVCVYICVCAYRCVSTHIYTRARARISLLSIIYNRLLICENKRQLERETDSLISPPYGYHCKLAVRHLVSYFTRFSQYGWRGEKLDHGPRLGRLIPWLADVSVLGICSKFIRKSPVPFPVGGCQVEPPNTAMVTWRAPVGWVKARSFSSLTPGAIYRLVLTSLSRMLLTPGNSPP